MLTVDVFVLLLVTGRLNSRWIDLLRIQTDALDDLLFGAFPGDASAAPADPDDTVTRSPSRYFHSRVLKLSLLVPKKCT